MTNDIGRLRTGAVGAFLLASSALTAPALAQELPRYSQVDANGVDLVTGQFSFSVDEGSIGSGVGALNLVRNWAGSAGWTDNWTGILYVGDAGYIVEFGTYSDSFTLGGSWPITFTANKSDGATLDLLPDGTYRYRSRDGTTIIFSAVDVEYSAGYHGPACARGGGSECGIPMLFQRPDGMTYTFNWDFERRYQFGGWVVYPRFRGVSNSANYSFTVNYATNTPGSGVPVANWFLRTGAQFTNLDGAPASLPTVTYSAVSSTVLDVTDTGGQTWRLTTAPTAMGVRRPGSSTDNLSATLSGGVVTQVVHDGVTTGYSRSVSGSTVTTTITLIDGDSGTTDPQTVVVADSDTGRITSITDPLSQQTGFQYDGSGRLTRTTLPEGNSTSHTYDARGNVTETRLREKGDTGDTGDDIVTTASYDSTCSNVVTCNQPNSVTDARGNATDFTYDSTHGGVLTVTAPAPSGSGDRPQTRYTYSQVTAVTGQPVYLPTAVSACASGTSSTCVGTANEARSVTAYDTDNLRVTSTTQRNGDNSVSATSAFTYDAVGNLLTEDGPLSGTADTSRFRYDDARRMIGTIGPDPDGAGALVHRAERHTYTNGLLTKVETGTVNSQSDGDWAAFSAAHRIETDYDASSRAIQRRLMSGSTTYSVSQTGYDSLGRVKCQADRMNPAEFASLTTDACALDSEGTGGNAFGPDRITRTYYDAAGRVSQIRTAYGVSGQEAQDSTFTYTVNGQVLTATDANGNVSAYQYDGFDRRLAIFYPNASGGGTSSSDSESFGYTADLLTTRTDRSGATQTLAYDNLGRATSRDLPGTEPTVSYTYDLMGRMLTASTSAYSLSFTWDALGRNLTQVGPHGTASSLYDAAGRRTRLTYPGSGLYIDYDYTPAGQLQAIRENGATSGAGLLAVYSYDSLGRRTQILRGNATTTAYAYDVVSRPTSIAHNFDGSANDLTLGLTRYNPLGQIVETTRSNDAYAWGAHYAVNRNYTANGLNQYSAAGSVTPTYDNRGNLTQAGGATYAYNSDNMLVTASGGVQLSYDPLNRLSSTTGSASFTRFAFDEQALIAEYDNGGTLQRRYVHGPGGDEPLVWYEGTGTSDRRYYHADERGSVIALSNGSGAAATIYAYDEQGIPAGSSTDRFRYTGQQWLAELGMYHYRARIYSPTLGRFLQTDPIGYGDGMNLYSYVGNDPVNLIDPSGQARICVSYPEGRSGPHVRCVDVDTTTNGRDLSKSEIDLLRTAYFSFIAQYGGRLSRPLNITHLIKPVYGGNLSQRALVSAASAFVGYVARRMGTQMTPGSPGYEASNSFRDAWSRVTSISITGDRSTIGAPVELLYGENPGTYEIRFFSGGTWMLSSPSDLARAFFHEPWHHFWRSDYQHARIDVWARRMMNLSGLGRCRAVNVFPGC